MKTKAALGTLALVTLLLFTSQGADSVGEAASSPLSQPEGTSPGNRLVVSQDIDVKWLKKEVAEVFRKNQVTQVRSWNGQRAVVTYHAPYLDSKMVYPDWLPSAFHWTWRLWWWLKAPWEVNYPHQWFWDSTAHAIVLSHLDPSLAKAEIQSLLYAQREDGFIPHLIWNPEKMHWVAWLLSRLYPTVHCSSYLQSPNIAEAVFHIYQQTGDLDFVRETLPALKRYYVYIDRERARDDDGLPEIIHSYESGKDRSPEYDVVYGESNLSPAWRGPMTKLLLRHRRMNWDTDRILQSDLFQVKDTLFCCIYARNLSVLSQFCELAGDADDVSYFQGKADKVEQSILTKMYEPESGLFYSLDSRLERDEQIRVNTVSTFLPLILDNITESQVERLVDEHLLNQEEFWLRYPIPAQPANTSREKASGHIVWRGTQTWVYTNWYISRGLRHQAEHFPQHADKYNRIADELVERTYELVRRSGFREYYDSRSGDGDGAYNFGWTTLILDMVL